MNMRPAAFIDETAAWRARVAAEVAARYGALVAPEVVSQVPMGASGLPQPVWNGRELVYDTKISPMRAAINIAWRKAHPRVKAAVSPAVAERRETLRGLHAAGYTDPQLVQALGCSLVTVRSDRYAMGLRANPVVDAAQLRVARVLDMLQRGFPVAQIARKENLTVETVCRTARERLNMYFCRRANGLTVVSPMAEQRARREAEVARLAALGGSATDIGRALKTDVRTIKRVAQALGLDLPLVSRAVIVESTVALRLVDRRQRVAELLQQGHSKRHIAKLLTVSRATIQADCAAMAAQPDQPQQVAA